MSKTNPARQQARCVQAGALIIAMAVLAGFAGVSHAATIEELAAKQRTAMNAEIDKKIADLTANKQQASSATPAVATLGPVPTPSPAPAAATKPEEPKKPVHTIADDIRVNGIYTDARGAVTVDVSVNGGPSFPLTKGRAIDKWQLAAIDDTSVTFRNGKADKVIYMAQPSTNVTPQNVATTLRPQSQQMMPPFPFGMTSGPTSTPLSSVTQQ